MNPDDEDAALAYQQELEHWSEDAQRLLWEDAEAYNSWLDQLSRYEFEGRTHG